MAITTQTWTPSEICGPGPQEQFLAIPVTVASGADLAEGTILGKIAASGKYVAYDDDGSDDGRRVAVGILGRKCAAAAADQHAVMYVRGNFVKSLLTGLDSNGETDLDARTVGDFLLI